MAEVQPASAARHGREGDPSGASESLSLQEVADRRAIASGSSFERDIGYSRAVVVGDWVFVSGTTGFDYATMTIAEDAPAQARQALANIKTALAPAGATLKNVARVRYILPDRADFEPCWPILREAFAAAPPAATMIVAGLSDPRMRIEIEATAHVSSAVSAGSATAMTKAFCFFFSKKKAFLP